MSLDLALTHVLLCSDENLDCELMQRLAGKEPSALEAIYDRYGRTVFGMFLKTTRNQSTAEDLVQDLFLRLWDRADEFDPLRGRVAGWILSIARNMAIDHVRSGHAQFLLRTDQVNELQIVYPQHRLVMNYETILNNNSLVTRSMHGLSLKHRYVLELAYYEGFSQTEIAERMKVPLGTVKSWMRAGLRCLRLTMETGSARMGQDSLEPSPLSLQLAV